MGAIGFSFLSSSIYEYNNEQYSAIAVNFIVDIDSRTIKDNILVYDTSLQKYIDIFTAYERKTIYIIPKSDSFITGQKYIITIKKGLSNIFGETEASDIVLEYIYDGNVVIKKPIIKLPSNNSIVEDKLTISIEPMNVDYFKIQISDSPDFYNLLVDEKIYDVVYNPIINFDNDKMYYIRAFACKEYTDTKTNELKFAESLPSNIVQFQYKQKEELVLDSLKLIKSSIDDIKVFGGSNIVLAFNKDISSYDVNVYIYNSQKQMFDIILDDPINYLNSGLVGLVSSSDYSVSLASNLISITFSNLLNNTAYYIVVLIKDNENVILKKLYKFITPKRKLYIDPETIIDSLKNFDITYDYVLNKISEACDRADYLSIRKIKQDDVPYIVKQYVYYKTLLGIAVDYQLGYINQISGSIGSFSFNVSGSQYNTVSDAIDEIKKELLIFERALLGYEKPGYAEYKSAQREASTIIGRQNI